VGASEITKNKLWIGNSDDWRAIVREHDRRIGSILDLRGPGRHEGIPPDIGLDPLDPGLPDEAPNAKDLDRATVHLHKVLTARGSGFMHCISGNGRSSTVAAAYLIRYEGRDVVTALCLVRQSRPTAWSTDDWDYCRHLFEFAEPFLKGARGR